MRDHLKPIYLVVLVIALSFLFCGSAQASLINLVPQQEGEINAQVGSALGGGTYLTTNPILASVYSQPMSAGYTNRSRLFIDDTSTSNTYGAVRFSTTDGGTTGPLGQYWFRPVAVKHILNGQNYPEQGNLEIGQYTFNFTQAVDNFTIYYFDAESANATGVTAINGVPLSPVNWVPAGADGNIYQQTFENIKINSFTLNLGKFNSSTGDGVNFQISGLRIAAPELPPVAMPLLAAILGMGLWVRVRIVR